MLRHYRAVLAPLVAALASAAAGGLPPSDVTSSLAFRAIAAYESLAPRPPARSSIHTAAISPDGRRVAVVVTLPPAADAPQPYPLVLQVWDSVTLKMLASRDLGVAGGPVGSGAPGEHDFTPLQCFLNYAPDGSFLVVTAVSARLRSGVIFSLHDARAELRFIAADDLREFRRIDLDLSRYSQAYGPAQIQLSPAGDRLALPLSLLRAGSELMLGGCEAFQGTEVRVYEVKTGRLVWTATFSGGRGEGVAWSPDGLKLALTLPSTRGDKWFSTRCPQRRADNLLILESGSGRVLTSISTGDLPGPVCFGPHDEVFTAPIHFYVRSRKGEQAKVWNAQTGALERTIGLRGRDVHNILAFSRDGGVLVGYVGKEKLGFSLLEDVQEILDQRFAVWDAATGGLIALSQDFIPRLSGRRGNGFQGLTLRIDLSADGRSLLADWGGAPAPLLLFDLPDVPARPAR